MALADLIRGVRKPSATATAATRATDEARKAEPQTGAVAAVAGVAVAKPPSVISARWLLHFDAGEPVVVAADLPIEHAAVLAQYPSALAAEPVSAPMPQELPPAIATMFAACVEVGLYDEGDRQVLRAMHAADGAGTRELVEAMHARIGRCCGCKHFARPGLLAGYCAGRNDLEPAYGPRTSAAGVAARQGRDVRGVGSAVTLAVVFLRAGTQGTAADHPIAVPKPY